MFSDRDANPYDDEHDQNLASSLATAAEDRLETIFSKASAEDKKILEDPKLCMSYQRAYGGQLCDTCNLLGSYWGANPMDYYRGDEAVQVTKMLAKIL